MSTRGIALQLAVFSPRLWWQASSASLLSDGFVWFYVFTMETAEGQTVCTG